MKDNFSRQASDYAKFRPHYPDEMIDFIVSCTAGRTYALDVATGNGQLAAKLSAHFHLVYATDISEEQLLHAPRILNVIYRRLPAEHSDFKDHFFDLITVAEAVHWFDFDLFYDEVRRILKPGGTIAVLGYGLFSTNPATDCILFRFYSDILGAYWDQERRYIDAHYTSIPFPFDEVETPEFTNNFEWSFEQLLGYIETWSATEHYKAHNNRNPIDLIHDELKASWEISDRKVKFPLLLRIGKLKA